VGRAGRGRVGRAGRGESGEGWEGGEWGGLGRILDCQTPCMGIKAAQFAASLGAVPLEGLVSAHTEQPLCLRYILHACHPVGVSWWVGVCV